MISCIFQEVANGGMKGYERGGKKRLLGGQEATVTIYTGTKIEDREQITRTTTKTITRNMSFG